MAWRSAAATECSRNKAPTTTFSSTLMPVSGRTIWKVRAMPRSQACSGVRPVMSWPSNVTRPAVQRVAPAIRLKQVVLPAPLGPIRAVIEPRCTVKSTALTAVNPE